MHAFLIVALAVLSCAVGCKKPSGAPEHIKAPPATDIASNGVPQRGSTAEGNLMSLTLALQEFVGKNKRFPADLEELVAAKLVSQIPPPPAGMRYQIDQRIKQVRLVPN